MTRHDIKINSQTMSSVIRYLILREVQTVAKGDIAGRRIVTIIHR